MAGTSVQGIVKTQLEVVEVENAPLCPHIYSLYFARTVECPSILKKMIGLYNQSK